MRHSPTCLAKHRPRRFVEALKQISRPLPANENKPKEGGGPTLRWLLLLLCSTSLVLRSRGRHIRKPRSRVMATGFPQQRVVLRCQQGFYWGMVGFHLLSSAGVVAVALLP